MEGKEKEERQKEERKRKQKGGEGRQMIRGRNNARVPTPGNKSRDLKKRQGKEKVTLVPLQPGTRHGNRREKSDEQEEKKAGGGGTREERK